MIVATKEAKVNQLMETDLVTIDPEASIYDAAKLMNEKKIGIVLVVDREKKLLGLVTDRDIVTQTIAQKKYMATSPVKEIMKKNPMIVSPEVTCKDALRIMGKYGYRRLPVEKDGKLIGIISIADLAQIAKCSDECIDSLLKELSRNVKPKKKILLKA